VSGRQGTNLLLVLLLLYAGCQICRGSVFSWDGPPAFFEEQGGKTPVLLGRGFPHPGVHQFSDAVTPLGVIKMTGLCPAPGISPRKGLSTPLRSGEALEITSAGSEVVEFKRLWMPAGQRITLGIALHPDRMSLQDWEDLPGIGPRTAEIIEKDRQINGDFHTLQGVERVPGIGPGRIRKWKKFFQQ
jgi:competence protein ComEA